MLSKSAQRLQMMILHRGSDIKVLMTQEHYLNLVSRLTLYEPKGDVVPSKSAKAIEKNILAKLQLLEGEPQDGKRTLGKVGKNRPR